MIVIFLVNEKSKKLFEPFHIGIEFSEIYADEWEQDENCEKRKEIIKHSKVVNDAVKKSIKLVNFQNSI